MKVAHNEPGHEAVVLGCPPTGVMTLPDGLPFANTFAVADEATSIVAAPSVVPVGQVMPGRGPTVVVAVRVMKKPSTTYVLLAAGVKLSPVTATAVADVVGKSLPR